MTNEPEHLGQLYTRISAAIRTHWDETGGSPRRIELNESDWNRFHNPHDTPNQKLVVVHNVEPPDCDLQLQGFPAIIADDLQPGEFRVLGDD